MTEEQINLILKIGTFDGVAEYNNFEEVEADYKNAGGIALNPDELKRLIYTAYQIGFSEGKENDD